MQKAVALIVTVIAGGIGAAFAKAVGAAVFLVAGTAFVAYRLLKKFMNEAKAPWLLPCALIIAHVTWFSFGAIVTEQWDKVLFDVLVLISCVAWLLWKPSIYAVVTTVVFEISCVVMNGYQISELQAGSSVAPAMFLHIILRLVAIFYLVMGTLETRKARSKLAMATTPSSIEIECSQSIQDTVSEGLDVQLASQAPPTQLPLRKRSFGKRILIYGAYIFLAIAALIGAAWGYEFFTQDFPESRVAVSVAYSPQQCTQAYPLLVSINNNSYRTVLRTNMNLEARRPGRSTNLISFLEDDLNDDQIIKPDERKRLCWEVPSSVAKNGFKLDELVWTVSVNNVVFQ